MLRGSHCLVGTLSQMPAVSRRSAGWRQRRKIDGEQRLILATYGSTGEGMEVARLVAPLPAMPIFWGGWLGQYSGWLVLKTALVRSFCESLKDS